MTASAIQLVSVDALIPALYNPRKVDPTRLGFVKMSLQKLGWMLPIYATREGEILSGHQRHHVAVELGYLKIPVVFIDGKDDVEKKNLNLIFNKATNDMSRNTKTADMFEALRTFDFSFCDAIKDKKPNTPGAYPCMRTKPVSVKDLVILNTQNIDTYAVSAGRTLLGHGISMPIVLDSEKKVVNGGGRLAAYSYEGRDSIDALILTNPDEITLARMMLNFLSMDFDLTSKYGDVLRYNSFRRAMGVRQYIGCGFVTEFPFSEWLKFEFTPENTARWKNLYGTSVVDFGAGQRQETAILRSIGVDCVPFEPYCLDPTGASEAICIETSRAVARNFLAEIATGRKFTSLFLSSVLQSVPFPSDREHVLCLIHALASHDTVFRVLAKGIKVWNSCIEENFSTSFNVGSSSFVLEEEPHLYLSSAGTLPKVQKFYSKEDFDTMLSPWWHDVATKEAHWVHSHCRKPKPVNPERLAKAIEFEFDLPYPSGERMGLVAEAKAAYGQRLGLVIP